jgi:hypothetical protein
MSIIKKSTIKYEISSIGLAAMLKLFNQSRKHCSAYVVLSR